MARMAAGLSSAAVNLVAVGLAALLITGCSSRGQLRPAPSSGATTTATTTTTASSAAPSGPVSTVHTTPASPTRTAAVSTTPPPATPTVTRCHTRGLRGGMISSILNTTPVAYRIPLINIISTPCVMFGWPGTSFRDTAGHDLADAARTGAAPHHVTLRAGAAVDVTLFVSNPAGGNGCVPTPPTTARLLLTPPDETAPLMLTLPHPQYACHPSVYPVGATYS